MRGGNWGAAQERSQKYFCPPGGGNCGGGGGNCGRGGCSNGGYGACGGCNGYKKNGYNYAGNALGYPRSFNNPYKYFNKNDSKYYAGNLQEIGKYYGGRNKFAGVTDIDRYYGGQQRKFNSQSPYDYSDKYTTKFENQYGDDKYNNKYRDEYGDNDKYEAPMKKRANKLFISRMAFEGLQQNLRRTRFLGVLLSIFSALTVGLGLASILIYNTGVYQPTNWCTNPFPKESRLVQSLFPVAPAFNYIVIVSGFLGIFPLVCGLMTSFLTRIYGDYANAAMYLSFISVAVLPPMFALSLVAFLMTFGENGSKPPCEALSAVSMLIVVHAVVCSLLLYIIYYTMSRFLKKLKEDPSVDYITLKKYYGKKKIAVVDDGFQDDDEKTRGCCDCNSNNDDQSDLSDYEDDAPPNGAAPYPYPQPPYQYGYRSPQYPAYPSYAYPAPRFNPYAYMPRY